MHDFVHVKGAIAGPCLDLVEATWMTLAAEHRASGDYATRFMRREYPYGNDLTGAVMNDAPHAQVLEDGHGGFHMPSAVDWGAALARGTAKVTKDGRRYLIVPFRHYTPGSEGVGSGRARAMMPTPVYRDAMTALRGDMTRPAARDAAQRLREANRGLSRPYATMAGNPGTPPRTSALLARLAQASLKREGQPGYTWRAGKYEGMTRREQTNPTTGRSSGVFMTFRVMTEDSLGWFMPPQPGYHFAEKTVAAVKEQLVAIVGAAARQDMVELVRTRIGRAA